MNYTPLKHKIQKMVFCGVVIFLINLCFSYLFPVLPISELGPASALPPVFGLLFGPWGALGSAVGYLGADILSGDPPEIYLVYFFVQFLYGYIPYKLWYLLGRDKTISPPSLDNVRNLTKFVGIMFVNAVVMAGFLGFILDGLGLYDLVSLTTIIFALNNFDFSIMFGTLVVIGANYYGISMIKPRISDKTRIPLRLYDALAVVAVVTGTEPLLPGCRDLDLFAGLDLHFKTGDPKYQGEKRPGQGFLNRKADPDFHHHRGHRCRGVWYPVLFQYPLCAGGGN
jgi:sigma-B regulation protein RsbU (phosphoserine phosphatase)